MLFCHLSPGTAVCNIGLFWTALNQCGLVKKSCGNVFVQVMICRLLAGIILCKRPANEKWCYIVTPSRIGWVHTQNDPCGAPCPYLMNAELFSIEPTKTNLILFSPQ